MSAFVLTAGMVAAATGGSVAAGPADRVFDSVSTDTRTLAPGALYVALRGERFDGHHFLPDAVARGAAGVLVSSPPEVRDGASVILVDDTLSALQQLGREVRRRSGARVVAVTGSTGKTTTKEVTASLLSARYRVFRNPGNLNNHIGLPLSLMELRHGPDVAVVELGMNHAGEIRTLIGIAEPEIRVWTNVGDAHIGHFGSRDALARAKAELLEQAAPDTLVVANADDPFVARHMAQFAGRRRTFGERAGADIRAVRVVDRGFDGTEADVEIEGSARHLRVPLPGRAQLMNVLAAVTVATALDVPWPEITARVAALAAMPRRGAVARLAGGVRLIDDSYNASPAAVCAMLAALAATPNAGRRVAVLGEMHELGGHAAALHDRCGEAAARAGVDLLVAVGGAAADRLAAAAAAAGLSPDRIRSFGDSEVAADPVADLIENGDLVLVKGSRAARMDRVADRIAARGEG